MHRMGYFAYGEYTCPLHDSASYSCAGAVCEVVSTSRLAEPDLKKLHKYDARCTSYLWRVIEVVITRRS